MATPDPTGELSGAENIAPDAMDAAASQADPAMTPPATPPADMGNPAAGMPDAPVGLGDAMGGEQPNLNEALDAMDAALGSAMDSAMDQGGAPATAAPSDNPNAGMPDPSADTDTSSDDDPSAGMG